MNIHLPRHFWRNKQFNRSNLSAGLRLRRSWILTVGWRLPQDDEWEKPKHTRYLIPLLAPILAVCLFVGGVASAGPGELDRTFSSTPGVIFPEVAHAEAIDRTTIGTKVAVLPDGRMVVLGGFHNADDRAMIYVTRLMPDGTADPSFGHKGITRIQASHPDARSQISKACDFAVTPTGSILILAEARNQLDEPCFGLIQLTRDGHQDTAFGDSGFLIEQFSQAESPGLKESNPAAIAIQPDGDGYKILAFGSASVSKQVTEGIAARFHQDGTLDAGFAADGVNRMRDSDDAGSMLISAAEVARDGSIVIVGKGGPNAAQQRALVARLLPNGSIDQKFCSNTEDSLLGPAMEAPSAAMAVTLASDGKIIVAIRGTSRQNDERIYLTRHMPDGKDDTTFGNQGIFSIQLANGDTETRRSAPVDIKSCPDGRIVVGAGVITSGGEALRFLRLLPTGARDKTFGTEGIVGLRPCRHSNTSALSAMAVGPDGKIVGTGQVNGGIQDRARCALVRLQRDGSFDTSLGNGGIIKTQSSQIVPPGKSISETAARQPDGKFVVAGQATNVNGDLIWAIARFLADGKPDLPFGRGGSVQIDAKHPAATPDPHTRATSVSIDSSGRIVVAGSARGSKNERCIVAARLLADGKLDQTFGAAGLSRIQTGSPQEATSRIEWPEGMGIQSDGTIIIVGTTRRAEQANWIIASLQPDGKQNQAFGQNGITIVDASHAKAQDKTSNARAISILANDSFIVGGNSSDHLDKACSTLAHFDRAGRLQANFGNNGMARMQPQIGVADTVMAVSSRIDSVAIQTLSNEVKIVAAGVGISPDGRQLPSITRITSNGKVDTTFGKQGTSVYNSDTLARATMHAIDATGDRIIASGAVLSKADAWTDAVFALSANGQWDTTFGNNGMATIEVPIDDRTMPTTPTNRVIVMPDKIVVATNGTNRNRMPCMAIAALNITGQTVDSFGDNGGHSLVDASFAKTHPERSGAAATIADRDGKLITAGIATDIHGNRAMAITRFHPSGEIDLGFADKGTRRIQASPPGTSKPSSAVRAVALQEDGKIVVTGTAKNGDGTDTIAIARVQPDGSLDTSFGRSGVVLPHIVTKQANLKWSMGNAVGVQPDRARPRDPKIVVAGVATDPDGKRCFVIMRLLSNGQLDSEFAPRTTANKRRLPADEQPSPASYVNNIAYIQASAASFSKFSEATSLVIQSDQKIVVAGQARDGASTPAMALIRLQPNGTLDPSFGTAGIVLHQASRTRVAPRPPFRLPSGRTLPVPPDPDPTPTGHLDQGPTSAQSATAHALVDHHQGKFYDGRNPLDHNSPQDSEINSITIGPGGRIVGAGSAKSPDGDIEMAITQFMPDGSIDPAFGTGGTTHVQASTDPMKISRALGVTTHQGKIVATGIAREGGRIGSATIRLHPNGQLDETFGAKGLALMQAAPGTTSQDQTFTPALARPDNRTNKIILAGTTTNADGTSELTLIRLET